MATTYYSDVASAGRQPQENPEGVQIVPFKFVGTAALVVDDIIKLVKIPNYAYFLGCHIEVPDLDTATTPAITLDLGDDVDDDRYLAAGTQGQSADKITNEDLIAGILPYQYKQATGTGVEGTSDPSSHDHISLHVDTAPTTGATSFTIKGWVMYTTRAGFHVAAS